MGAHLYVLEARPAACLSKIGKGVVLASASSIEASLCALDLTGQTYLLVLKLKFNMVFLLIDVYQRDASNPKAMRLVFVFLFSLRVKEH